MELRLLCLCLFIALFLPVSAPFPLDRRERVLGEGIKGTAGSSPTPAESPASVESPNPGGSQSNSSGNTAIIAQLSPAPEAFPPFSTESPMEASPPSRQVFAITPPSPSPAKLAPQQQSKPLSLVSSTTKGISDGTIAAISIAAAASIVIVCVSFCLIHKAASVRPWKSSMSGELQKGFKTGVPAFSRSELEDACEDFSNIIGKSADCVIFKGTLSTGMEIAVTSIRVSAKRWSTSSELFFWRKVESLSRLKHKNLANLAGYFVEEQPFVRMLVFEYASNGTVYEHIHNKETEHLDWTTRMRIVMGVAYVLEYMHHGVNPPVNHGNFDSNSVYLSEDYAAKLADFDVWKPDTLMSHSGQSAYNNRTMSKSCSGRSAYNKGRMSKSLSGLSGYSKGSMSSRYNELDFSDRFSSDFENDIFNFGVFLLEIVSGRLPYCRQQGYLADWAVDYLSTPDLMSDFVDPNLKYCDYKQVDAVCEVARDCVQMHFSQGLSMRQITSHLYKSLAISPDAASPKGSPLVWAEMEILSQD